MGNAFLGFDESGVSGTKSSLAGGSFPNLKNNIVAYWSLDTTAWSDSSGNGHALTNTGAVTTGAGVVSNCAVFNGLNYLQTTFSPIYGAVQTSIACWLKPTWLAFQYNPFFTLSNSLYPYGSQTRLYYAGNSGIGQSVFNLELDVYSAILTLRNLPIGDANWHHWVFSFDGLTMNVYRDSINVGNISTDMRVPNFADTIAIGGSGTHTPFTQLAGSIDEFGIWSRALSQVDVNYLYNNGSGRSYSQFI